jgi:hypothetical protein
MQLISAIIIALLGLCLGIVGVNHDQWLFIILGGLTILFSSPLFIQSIRR